MKNYKNQKIIVTVVLAIMFLTMAYRDLIETSTKSYLLLNSLFSGKFPVGYPFESAFYIPIHFCFAIWNLPLWIIYNFGLGSPDAVINILWAKLLIVTCLFGIVVIFKKILDEANFKGNKDFWCLMLVTSLLVFPPMFDMSQYDCIGFFFGLWGTLLAIRCENDKLSWKALLLLSFASSFKLLFLFAAICVIFIKNNTLKRNITDVLASLGGSVFFVVLSKILASLKGPTSNEIITNATTNINIVDSSAEISVGMAERLFQSTMPGGMYKISISFLLIFALFFALFLMKRAETKQEQIYMIAFSSSTIYLILMTFCLAHPQWSIFPGIFLILLLALSKDKYKKRNLICNEIFELCLILQQFGYYTRVYLNENEFNYTLFKNIENHFISSNLETPAGILLNFGGENLMNVLASLSLVSVITILIINNPWKKTNIQALTDESQTIERKTINFRTIIMLIYLLSGLIIRFVL